MKRERERERERALKDPVLGKNIASVLMAG